MNEKNEKLEWIIKVLEKIRHGYPEEIEWEHPIEWNDDPQFNKAKYLLRKIANNTPSI